MPSVRGYQAGESLEDHCRVCKTDRLHTVIAADAAGLPLRVVCGYCGSEHNYRGGPRGQRQPATGIRQPGTWESGSRSANQAPGVGV
jgi:hypothetical protein